MKFNKKAQGLSLNVVVIAAIALLVLVVLGVIFLRGAGNFEDGSQCIKAGGLCSESCEAGFEPNSDHECKEGKICCVSALVNT
jgi:hypothetical protein